MTRPCYDPGDGGGTPEYRTSNQSPRQSPTVHSSNRNIHRPACSNPDRSRGPPAMRPDHAVALPERSPRRLQAPQQQQYYAPEHAWHASERLYDGSGYDYEEDYGQNDQWPLPSSAPAAARPMPAHSSSPHRAPRRPQRPDEARGGADHPRGHLENPRVMLPMAPAGRQHCPPSPASHHGNGQWTGDGYSYRPPPNYALPDRPPPDDFTAIPPYLQQQMPPQGAYRMPEIRRPPLGPPPSSRRGPPSYYPQAGPVHPIQEESDSARGSARTVSAHTTGHESKTSFASSNAIPIGISQHHLDRGRDVTQPPPVQRPHFLFDSDNEGDEYDDSPTEPAIARGEVKSAEAAHTVEPAKVGSGVVRKASLGKRSKPTLTTVRSSDHMQRTSGDVRPIAASQDAPVPANTPERVHRSRALAKEMLEGHVQRGVGEPRSESPSKSQRAPTVAAAAAMLRKADPAQQMKSTTEQRTPESIFQTGTALRDPSPDDRHGETDTSALKEVLIPQPPRSRPRSPVPPPNVSKVSAENLEKGATISSPTKADLSQSDVLSDSEGKRRPLRLNIDAVREAEARGSLTSLPDLIRRATKLASNLDRGRTASKMGVEWMTGAGTDEKNRKSEGMSDILNAFPDPALLTPSQSRTAFRRSLAALSFRNRHSQLHSESDTGAIMQPTRCCGMSRWLFLCLLLCVFLLVAAAIIIPVVFLVILPSQKHVATSKVGSCAAQLTCENGGTNIFGSDGACECLCINGYTGSTCTRKREAACTSIAVGPSGNATIGETLPRLLDIAQTDYGIPLAGQELVGLFSRTDLSCNVQNQLVTFDGESSKRMGKRSVRTATVIRHVMKQAVVAKRDESSASSSASTAATSDSIGPTTGTSTARNAASTTSAWPSLPSASSSTGAHNSTIDFARIAVLYVFQDSQLLKCAIDAQDNLQSFLRIEATADGQSASAANFTLGNGYSMDLEGWYVGLRNGTKVGRGKS